MMYKLAVKRYLQFFVAFVIIVSVCIWIRDPYMIFHKNWSGIKQIHNNLRIQNYGLVKYSDFDSIIIGTSMIENTSAKEASEKLNSKFVNLSISGGSFYERYKILNLALQERAIKHIIYSLDYKFNEPKEVKNTFYAGLYDNEIVDKLNVYMTDKALICIFLNSQCDMIEYDLDRPMAWYRGKNHNRRFGGFKNWIKYYEEDEQIQDVFNNLLGADKDYTSEYKEYKQIIDDDILPLLQHSKTQHSIIVPPYSLMWWSLRKDYLDEYFKPYIYLIDKTANMDNVKIYWFYDDDFSGNIKNYKDLTHFHHSHNSRQIDAIQKKKNIINKENYQSKLKKFKSKILNFNIEKYIRMIPKEYRPNK